MDEEFWQSRWDKGQIGFHEPAPHPFLMAHFSALAIALGAPVFLPLCGKTLDIDWLLRAGHPVVGIEFNEAAVLEVFARLALEPEVRKIGALKRLRAGDLTLFCGDFFALEPAHIAPVSAVFDRGAMVAVAPEQRQAYVDHLIRLCPQAALLVVTYDYDQSTMDGPPFAVSGAEIDRRTGSKLNRTLLERRQITGSMSGRADGTEEAHLLSLKAGLAHRP